METSCSEMVAMISSTLMARTPSSAEGLETMNCTCSTNTVNLVPTLSLIASTKEPYSEVLAMTCSGVELVLICWMVVLVEMSFMEVIMEVITCLDEKGTTKYMVVNMATETFGAVKETTSSKLLQMATSMEIGTFGATTATIQFMEQGMTEFMVARAMTI